MAFLPSSPVPAASSPKLAARTTRRRPRVVAASANSSSQQHTPHLKQPASSNQPASSKQPPSPPPSPSPRPPPNTSANHPVSRRVLLTAAAGAALLVVTNAPQKTTALSLAPTPINPYARRRRERVYREYTRQIEETIESVPVADFKKLIQTGGGGISVSYRVAGFAAFAASAISTAIVHPIDSIKTRLQARGTDLDQGRSLWHGLYNGIFSNIMKEAPNAAIYLAVYELIKDSLTNLSSTSFFHDLPLLTFLVAGALGDAIGSVVRVPAEIINKRLQLGVNTDWRDAANDAFLTKPGRRASVVAWNAVLLRDVPYGGLQIMIYEFGKQMLATHPAFLHGYFAQPGLMVDVLMGAFAGAAAAVMTTPADVLVTRLSVQDPQSFAETGEYVGVLSTAKRIFHEDGIAGFFKGTLERGIYYAPLIGLFFALYELNRGWISHPDTILAQATHLKLMLAADWRVVSQQLASFYESISPFLTGVVWLISEEMPFLLSYSFVPAGSEM